MFENGPSPYVVRKNLLVNFVTRPCKEAAIPRSLNGGYEDTTSSSHPPFEERRMQFQGRPVALAEAIAQTTELAPLKERGLSLERFSLWIEMTGTTTHFVQKPGSF